jgi:hypothetical protein
MSYFSVSYTVELELKFAPDYKWTSCGKCFNSSTGNQIKQSYKNGMIGYYIKSKFYSLKRLRQELVKIKVNNCPF